MEALRRSAAFAKQTGWSAERLILTAATICGLVGIWVPEILGLGISTINAMLDGAYQMPALLLLLVVKIAMTALCIGFGLFGGVFSPALFVGVAAGGVVAQLATILGVPDLSVAVSIAAMAAVAANVIGAPVAAVLIVLELTQSLCLCRRRVDGCDGLHATHPPSLWSLILRSTASRSWN